MNAALSHFHNASAAAGDPSDSAGLTFERVEARLIEAMLTLRGLPQRDYHRLVATDGPWSQVRAVEVTGDVEDGGLRTVAATRQQVAEMEEALEWVLRWVPTGETRIILAYALALKGRGVDRGLWVRVRELLIGRAGGAQAAKGWTTDGLRMRYGRAVTGICKGISK